MKIFAALTASLATPPVSNSPMTRPRPAGALPETLPGSGSIWRVAYQGGK
jgi:hypothetical protein